MKAWVVIASLLAGCTQQKSFSGPASAAVETDGIVPEETIVPVVDDCVEGDRVIVPWSGPVKDCMDSGKTWHFESRTCMDMPKANFICDWDTLQARLKELNLLSDNLQKDAAAGAKLVSCGQSNDGNRIAVQWLKVVGDSSCQKLQEGTGVTTGCYTHYADRDPPPPATTDAERRQRVNECLKSL